MTQEANILWQDEKHPRQSISREEAMTEHPDAPATTFTALYRRHVQRVYAYCFRRTGNHADAEDLAEQVFVEALEKFNDYREQGKAAAWLFTIAHSRVVDHYRRRRPDVSFDETHDRPAAGPTPESRLVDAERRQHLFSLLDALHEDQRELILLRFGAELSFREIGDIAGKSEAAVKMALYRLLQELRTLWHLHDPQESTTEEDHD